MQEMKGKARKIKLLQTEEGHARLFFESEPL